MIEDVDQFIEFIRNDKRFTVVVDVGSTSGIVVARPGQSTWFAKTYQPKGPTIIEKAIDLALEVSTMAQNNEQNGVRLAIAVVRWPGAARTKFSYGAEVAYISAIGSYCQAHHRMFCILDERKARTEIIKSKSKTEVENWWMKKGLPTTSNHVRDAAIGALYLHGLKTMPMQIYHWS